MKFTAGDVFRAAMKKEDIKQKELAEKLGIHANNVSQAIRNFDGNKGNISTLIEYAAAIGYEVVIDLKKKD